MEKPPFLKMEDRFKRIYKDIRYIYDVEINIHTVKEGREKVLSTNVKMPVKNILDANELFDAVEGFFNGEFEANRYDNYDVVNLDSYIVTCVYDSEIE